MYTLSKNTPQHANEAFKLTLWKARRDALFRRMLGKNTNLERIGEAGASASRRHLGITSIPVKMVAGTLGRSSDFDHRFRPLHDHLQARWIAAALSYDGEGWAPIKVLKKGSRYYVIDGHKRASVAHIMGMPFIDAQVWEVVPEPGVSEEAPATSRHIPMPMRKPSGSVAGAR